MVARRGARAPRALASSLWVVALFVAGYLADERYHNYSASTLQRSDFALYFRAARQIVAGHSPYTVLQYVYPPLFALLLAPITGFREVDALAAWTAVGVAAVAIAAAGAVIAEGSRLGPVQRPILFGFCAVTGYHFWPLMEEIRFGQADALVLAALSLSLVASVRSRPAWSGALVGVAALMKAWPAGAALYFLRRGGERRARSLAAVVALLCLAPAAAVAAGGATGLVAMFRNIFDARSQASLIAYSVWGIPRLVFSRSGLAQALLVSPALRVVTTGMLLAWVIGLVVVSLRATRDEEPLTFWNVVVCVVLVLPVAHVAYCIYGLPIFWLWGARVLRAEVRDARVLAVFVVMVGWWLVLARGWPIDGSSHQISALTYSVPFVANIVAVTASVVGQRVAVRRGSTVSPSSLAGPSAASGATVAPGPGAPT